MGVEGGNSRSKEYGRGLRNENVNVKTKELAPANFVRAFVAMCMCTPVSLVYYFTEGNSHVGANALVVFVMRVFTVFIPGT